MQSRKNLRTRGWSFRFNTIQVFGCVPRLSFIYLLYIAQAVAELLLGVNTCGCLPMRQKEGLIKKVKHLLKKANMPRFLHYFGPKLYELWQHVFALFFKANCKLSYRRTTVILRDLGFKVATKSTLQRYASKLKLPFWMKIFNFTIEKSSSIFAIDGTGLEKTCVSKHYIKRIDGHYSFSKGFHFSIIVNEKGKIQSLRLRKKIIDPVLRRRAKINNTGLLARV